MQRQGPKESTLESLGENGQLWEGWVYKITSIGMHR